VNLGWVTAYGADLIVPAMLYYWTRQNLGLFAKLWKGIPPPFFTASLILILCVIWEFRQKYDSTFGTYDNWDLFVYLISMILCYYIDKKLNKVTVKLPTTTYKNNA